jgi:hypothetical protein
MTYATGFAEIWDVLTTMYKLDWLRKVISIISNGGILDGGQDFWIWFWKESTQGQTRAQPSLD